VYSQTLGTIFTESIKPYEVEIVVAEAGTSPETDQIYRLTYDGSIADEQGSVAIGGQSEQVNTSLRSNHSADASLADALKVAVAALKAGAPPTPTGAATGTNGERTLTAANLEVAILDRNRTRRLFRRIVGGQLDTLLADLPAPVAETPAAETPAAETPATETPPAPEASSAEDA
jgi:proteasome alpha subunit